MNNCVLLSGSNSINITTKNVDLIALQKVCNERLFFPLNNLNVVVLFIFRTYVMPQVDGKSHQWQYFCAQIWPCNGKTSCTNRVLYTRFVRGERIGCTQNMFAELVKSVETGGRLMPDQRPNKRFREIHSFVWFSVRNWRPASRQECDVDWVRNALLNKEATLYTPSERGRKNQFRMIESSIGNECF